MNLNQINLNQINLNQINLKNQSQSYINTIKN